MALKSCSHCGVVPFNHICPVAKKNRNDKDRMREDKEIYWSRQWRKLRDDVLEYQEYICLWSLYVDGVVREATVCHHITTLIDDDTKAYDIENVIGIDKSVHDRVHELYKTDKVNTMKMLRECMRLWDKGKRLDSLGILKNNLISI